MLPPHETVLVTSDDQQNSSSNISRGLTILGWSIAVVLLIALIRVTWTRSQIREENAEFAGKITALEEENEQLRGITKAYDLVEIVTIIDGDRRDGIYEKEDGLRVIDDLVIGWRLGGDPKPFIQLHPLGPTDRELTAERRGSKTVAEWRPRSCEEIRVETWKPPDWTISSRAH